MALCRNDLETKQNLIADLKNSGNSLRNTSNNKQIQKELIAELNYWRSKHSVPEKVTGSKTTSKQVVTHNNYTEYFAARQLDPKTGEQQTAAELVTEHISPKIVLLSFIATRSDARCSGIGSALLTHFREAIARDNPEATIFLEIEDPSMPKISEEERQIRTRRLNWYLRQGAIVWNGHYEIPNVFDKRKHGKKALFLALPKAGEQVTSKQLHEALLQVLLSYNISNKHWLYKQAKLQGEAITPEEILASQNLSSPAIGNKKPSRELLPQTLSFLKESFAGLVGTEYSALSPEEAIRQYIALKMADKREFLNKIGDSLMQISGLNTLKAA